MTSAEADLLATIALFPNEDTIRLMLADELQQNAENGAARADAIRRGVANPKWYTYPEFSGAFGLARGYPGVSWHTYKGLIAALTCTWETWLATGDNILARNWVPEVILSTPPGLNVTEFGGRPHASAPGIGRLWREYVRGEDVARIVLRADWPTVKRWVLPEPIRGVRWYTPPIEPWDDFDYRENESPAERIDGATIPPIGTVVETIDGRRGVLMTPVDARGLGCVRSAE